MGGGALEGVRIVEFGGLGPAPFAAMLLADMGADILRIDRPDAPVPVPDPITGRGRARLEANLKDPGDRDSVTTLIGRADVVIEGFRPGVMERLGLGPDDLHPLNPRLVYARMTGWGQDGPLSPFAGHDINYIAITGALAAVGPRERPVPPLSLIGDYGGGALYLVNGILAALLAAGRTGRGQIVDCAMCDGALSLMSFYYEMAADRQWVAERESNMLDGGAPFYGVYGCADGQFVAVGAIEPQFLASLCRGLGIDEAELEGIRDPECWPAIRLRLAEVIASRPRADWLERLELSDSCFSPVLGFHEAATHDHINARSSLVSVDGLLQPAPAPRFSGTPSSIRPERRREISLAQALDEWAG
jgi:alpha-methylacyl-CoA racemase